jgi:hypothetical protein
LGLCSPGLCGLQDFLSLSSVFSNVPTMGSEIARPAQ